MAETILVIEDDASIRKGLEMNLGVEGFNVISASDGSEGLALAKARSPDVVVLDLSLPKLDGLSILRAIRRTDTETPVLILSARGQEQSKVEGLSLGADDYITKPFDPLELIARVRALLRRAQGIQAVARRVITVGDLSLDGDTHEVRVSGSLVRLTPTESRLLEELMRHPGDVLTHRQLLEKVWGPAYVGDPSYLKVFVGRLRQKLGDDTDKPRYIATEWGVGYRFLSPRAT